MKRKMAGVLLLCAWALALSGCAARGDHRTRMAPRAAFGTGGNDFCTWRATMHGVGGKVVKGKMVITPRPGHDEKACTLEESDKLYIGPEPGVVREVIDINAAAFATSSTCRHCYANTSGGMSCITWQC